MTKTEQGQDPRFKALLEYLRDTRGFDFTGYKPPGLLRRIAKRRDMLGIPDFGQYQDYLEVHPEEFGHLFDYVLINVTSFFRDPKIWEYVAAEIVPALAERSQSRPIRVWSAGCASGEEAYTLAMLLAEALGRRSFGEQVKIFATDVDEEALAQARTAIYPGTKLNEVPLELREKYFRPAAGEGGFVFDKDLRRCVIFGRHNLLDDAPISRVDLLTCRNTLMYFNAETQSHVLDSLHFALNDEGLLILGTAEMLFSKRQSFAPIELKLRIFRKIPGRENNARPFTPEADGHADTSLHGLAATSLFVAGPLPQIILSREGALVGANARARQIFRLAEPDIGRPLRELEMYYRPVDLGPHIQAVLNQRTPVSVPEARLVGGPAEITYVSTELTPLVQDGGDIGGILISYQDLTPLKRLEEELQTTSQELETALEELQSTNEELETTNEELQSTNEELETTNEELQSTNEELETMNEELQSTNEELRTVNSEAVRHAEELGHGAFVASILGGLSSAVIAIGSDLRVSVWNWAAEQLWGLRAEEAAGETLVRLDIGLPVAEVMPHLLRVLNGEAASAQVSVGARNRRGRAFRCRVTINPNIGVDRKVAGVIMVMEDQSGESH